MLPITMVTVEFESGTTAESAPKWIIASNRLPFSYDPKTQSVKTASGGLVTAIGGIKTPVERVWLGCAPENLTQENWPEVKALMSSKNESTTWSHEPLFVSEKDYHSYYNNFSNDVLWPLLHYQNDRVKFNNEDWETYKKVNHLFAERIASIASPNDLVWIHDYHLFLVPIFLKKLRPELKVGFFLHVPFPSSEVFRQLPAREEILQSLLAADLVGFHDYSYLRHFCSSVLRILGLDTNFLAIKDGPHTTRLGVFPVSVETEDLQARASTARVSELLAKFKTNEFLFLGVDRLDYIKGLDLKLHSFAALLENYPEVRGKVSLLQVAVPTRTGAPEFIELAKQTAQLVGEINGKYSTPTWTPIRYLHSSVGHDELSALYRAADALVVTSKRDGMNLVALEYVAAQSMQNPGVVLLSEFTGAISALSHTIPINPWDYADTAEKMKLAMDMPRDERALRMKIMLQYLKSYTATDWAQSFISELEIQHKHGLDHEALAASRKTMVQILKRVRRSGANRIVVFIDYDGTLVPIESSPELATLPDSTRDALIRIQNKFPWLELVIVSGRNRQFLDSQFQTRNMALASEHGAEYFDPFTKEWHRRVHRNLEDWYPTAEKIMGHYAERTPRSFVEKKNFSLAWHYRQSPRDYGLLQSKKLAEELELGLANQPVTILRGKKVVEVRAAEADKGAFVSWYLDQTTTDTFAFAFGDDLTDEDMFKALKERGVSVKVGFGKTSADFRVRTQDSLLRYFNRLCNAIDELMRLTHRTTDLRVEEKAAEASASLSASQTAQQQQQRQSQNQGASSGEPTTLIASRTIARPLLHDLLND